MKLFKIKMRVCTILCILSAIIFSANCIHFVYKAQWQGDHPIITSFKTRHQAAVYILLYQTGGLRCFNYTECITRVQTIQSSSVKKWGQNIFNYLIGEDGNIYEGSGFYERIRFLRLLQNKCIVIALIGDYTASMIPESIEISLNELLEFAKQFRYLRRNFILLSSSQVKCNNEGPDSDTALSSSQISHHPNWKNMTLEIRSQIIKSFE